MNRNVSHQDGFHRRRSGRNGSVQARWWARACAACVLCAVIAIGSQAQPFTLANFNGPNGSAPLGTLVQGTDGNFYGTTFAGGANKVGTVFKLTPGGTLTTLYSFCARSQCSDGSHPYAGLVLGSDGNLYGTTQYGGPSGGTIFKITPAGALTTLHSFTFNEGVQPVAGLVQGTDGNFYGTATGGGTASPAAGTVFRMTRSGAVTVLHSFDVTDGATPIGTLVQGTDGNFYGTTAAGGGSSSCAGGCGTVFEITPGGTLTTLHSFDSTDGLALYAGLAQAADGNFYGTTGGGGSNLDGTIYQVTSAGAYTLLDSFDGTDGVQPDPALIQATDGTFYGTTLDGGASNEGTIFEFASGGTLTALHSFQGADGKLPVAGLLQATDGAFYGTTSQGGGSGLGTVFRFSKASGPFVKTVPTAGKVGQSILILGYNLTAATSVTFNGTAATFKVVSATLITATVPSGAKTGTVQVTTPGGTLSSNVPFTVL